MKNRIIGGIVSAVIFGVLFGGSLHLEHIRGGQLGRDGFLAKQAERFDRHFAKPDPIAVEVVVCLFMAGVIFGAYELVAFATSKALEKFDSHDENA